MNVIFTFEQTTPFTDETQGIINTVSFSVIPEMQIVDTIVDEEVVSQKIPYQANVEHDVFSVFEVMLEAYGNVDIIGKWADDGSRIECDNQKYLDLLKPIENYGIVEVMSTITDEEGNESEVVVNTYTAITSTSSHTLVNLPQVNVFNSNFTREL